MASCCKIPAALGWLGNDAKSKVSSRKQLGSLCGLQSCLLSYDDANCRSGGFWYVVSRVTV